MSLRMILLISIVLIVNSSRIDLEVELFLRIQGSFVVERNGKIESIKPPQIQNADEFPFDGGYRTEQGIFSVQGDIITPLDVPILSSIEQGRLWPDAVVPFIIAADVSQVSRDRLFKAMHLISNVSCVKFEQYNNQKHVNHRAVLAIQGGPICASFIGYHPAKESDHIFEQHLIISDLCPFGSVLHEIMHTLGFKHEEDRKDRSYNLKSEDSISNWSNDRLFQQYDHFSIMHRRSDVVSLDPLRQFMIGQRITLSFMDTSAINYIYKCSQNCENEICDNHGFVGSQCQCICPDGFESSKCDKITGISKRQHQLTSSVDDQQFGSNRKLIISDEKPALMLYVQHQPSIEYDSIHPELQAAVFVYNPNAKITVDLSQPDYLKNVYQLNKIHSDDQDKNQWLLATLTNQSLSNKSKHATLWVDLKSFVLDQYHPIYAVSPHVASIQNPSMLSCTFDQTNDDEYSDLSCPINQTIIFERRMNGTNGFMHIDNSMFNTSENSGLLRLGPIDAYNGVPSCMMFKYQLNGRGVGGISTYYIATKDNDRRQGSVIGWTNSGDQWLTHLQNVSDVYYDRNQAKSLMIEFQVQPGWDANSIIRIDDILVDECDVIYQMKSQKESM